MYHQSMTGSQHYNANIRWYSLDLCYYEFSFDVADYNIGSVLKFTKRQYSGEYVVLLF